MDTKINFVLSVKSKHVRSQAYQRVDLKGTLVATRCMFALLKMSLTVPPLRCKQMIESDAFSLCTPRTN